VCLFGVWSGIHLLATGRCGDKGFVDTHPLCAYISLQVGLQPWLLAKPTWPNRLLPFVSCSYIYPLFEGDARKQWLSAAGVLLLHWACYGLALWLGRLKQRRGQTGGSSRKRD
jgi:hypothetical protein